MTDEIPIACALSDPEKARRLAQIEAEVIGAALETRELADGYAFRYPSGGEWLVRLAEFVVDERQCCPFFTFEIVSEPGEGPIWLRLRGREGVKAFIRDQFLTAAS
jgi:hypothetical protein